jgi:hypothetical protein
MCTQKKTFVWSPQFPAALGYELVAEELLKNLHANTGGICRHTAEAMRRTL